jgi:hypothetical protein
LAKKYLIIDGINNKKLLATNSEGNIALHLAEQMWVTEDGVQKIYYLVKENQTTE